MATRGPRRCRAEAFRAVNSSSAQQPGVGRSWPAGSVVSRSGSVTGACVPGGRGGQRSDGRGCVQVGEAEPGNVLARRQATAHVRVPSWAQRERWSTGTARAVARVSGGGVWRPGPCRWLPGTGSEWPSSVLRWVGIPSRASLSGGGGFGSDAARMSSFIRTGPVCPPATYSRVVSRSTASPSVRYKGNALFGGICGRWTPRGPVVWRRTALPLRQCRGSSSARGFPRSRVRVSCPAAPFSSVSRTTG